MRRTIPPVVVALLMLATIAAAGPAAAAPKAFTFDTVCDMDGDGSLDGETPFVATGNHYPGWTIPWSPGDGLSGGILLGGTQYTYLDGALVGDPFTWAPPSGLMSRITRCHIEGPREDTPYKIVIEPAFVLFPGR